MPRHRPPTSPPHPTAARRGVSLIELAMMIAVFGVFSAIAVPRYGLSASRYRVEAASRRLISDLQQAKAFAVATSQAVTVTFDPAAGTYAMSFPDPAKPAQNYLVDLKSEPYAITTVTAPFVAGAALSINGYGYPAAGGPIVLRSGTAVSTLTISADSDAFSYVLQ